MAGGKKLGDWGENQACIFLKRHSFEIVERNYHTTFGEIDIIARKGGDFYFVEVKTRTGKEFANDESITYFKKRKMAKAVRAYCFSRKIAGDFSLIMAGLILEVNRIDRKINFRFFIIY